MFHKLSNYIAMIMMVFVLLGHHSAQAHITEQPHNHHEGISCAQDDCHHKLDLEICEQLEGDEFQKTTNTFSLPENSRSSYEIVLDSEQPTDEVDELYREHIPLAHNQLARAHL